MNKGKTIYTSVSRHIGQVKLSDAQSEVDRMNKQQKTSFWRTDDSEFLYADDETDDDVHNPCRLYDGYVWVVKG